MLTSGPLSVILRFYGWWQQFFMFAYYSNWEASCFLSSAVPCSAAAGALSGSPACTWAPVSFLFQQLSSVSRFSFLFSDRASAELPDLQVHTPRPKLLGLSGRVTARAPKCPLSLQSVPWNFRGLNVCPWQPWGHLRGWPRPSGSAKFL